MRSFAALMLISSISLLLASPAPASGSSWQKVVVRIPVKELAPEDRLQSACDMAINLADDLKKQKHATHDVVTDALMIRSLVCLKAAR
jgi:hypothetical protein